MIERGGRNVDPTQAVAPGRLRRRVWQIVQAAEAGDRASGAFDAGLIVLVLLNLVAVILESVDALHAAYGRWFHGFEVFSVAVFTFEYVARLWAAAEDPRYARPFAGRLRFALRPLPLLDLLAVAPFYLAFFPLDLRFLRALRLLRLVRLAKLGRYAAALTLFGRVVRARREELVLTSAVMGLLMLLGACLLYLAEHDAQPEVFADIPAALWWAVATLTTVGYGDIYPVTALGKVLASGVAILGIGLFALPAGILGSGFVEELARRRQPKRCPHCGEALQ